MLIAFLRYNEIIIKAIDSGDLMKKVLSYLLNYKKATIIALSLMIFELIVELVQPIIMGTIIDKGVMEQDFQTIVIWGSILLALSLLAFIGGIVSSYYGAEVSQGVGYDLRNHMYTKIQQFSTKTFQRFSTSSFITRLTNDVTQVQGLLFMGLRIMLRAPLYVLFGVIMAFTVHVKLAAILAVAVPIFIVIMLFVVSKGVRYFSVVQKKLDRVNTVIRENLIGIRLIKSFHRGNYEKKRFNKVNRSLMDVNRKALRFTELAMPIIMLGMNISLVIVLWFGAIELNIGGAEPGEIVAIINYGTRILGSLGMFGFLMMHFSRGRASAQRLAEVLEVEEDDSVTSDNENGKIKGDVLFQNVSFQYEEGHDTLTDISFHAKQGETIGILGETGSGKSTLIQLIPRLYEPTKGYIFIDNQNIFTIDKKELRQAIGLVSQEAHLFTGTIRDNIQWGKENAADEEIVEAAKKANIHDFIMTLPNQYETEVGQRGVNLSGGQKQRLSLARALVRRPKILLLDDSTSALDANTEMSVLQAIRNLACTTFIVAQKISSVMEADQILLLKDGRLVATGTHEQLLRDNAFYQSIYHSQIKEEVLHYDE